MKSGRLLLQVERAVHHGKGLQRVDRGPGDEGQICQRKALVGLELGLVSLPHPFHPLEINFDRSPDMGGGLLRLDHVLGDEDPNPVQLHRIRPRIGYDGCCGNGGLHRGSNRGRLGGRVQVWGRHGLWGWHLLRDCRDRVPLHKCLCLRSRDRRRHEICLDVPPGDPTTLTCAGQSGHIDLVLSNQLAHNRRQKVRFGFSLVGLCKERLDLGS